MPCESRKQSCGRKEEGQRLSKDYPEKLYKAFEKLVEFQDEDRMRRGNSGEEMDEQRT